MAHWQYKHSEDGDKLCKCPRCGWTGTLHQTEELQQVGEEPVQVCPKCSDDVPVIPAVARTLQGLDEL